MKTFCCLLVWCCLFSTIHAQTAIVLHASGQVQYFTSAQSPARKVYPGLEVSVNGKIRCLKNGNAKLLYNGKSYSVAGGRMQDISEIVKVGTGGSSIGFTGRFLKFVTESMQESESTEKLQKHHRRYMGKNSASIKGFSTKTYAIITPLTATGKLPAARVTFKWRKLSGTDPYTFHLMTANGAMIAELQVRDTLVTLDLDELAMELNEEYQWSVSRNADEESAVLPFELCQEDENAAQKALQQQAEYQSASPVEQGLMKAYYLEDEQAYYAADQLYSKLLSENPDNMLLHRLVAAFWARTNKVEEGEQLLKKSVLKE